MFADIYLPEKFIWKSNFSPNRKAYEEHVRYYLWDKKAIRVWRWDIASQERKICVMQIEIIIFVLMRNAKLIVSLEWQE